MAGVAFLLMRVQAALIVGRLALDGHGWDLPERALLGLLGGVFLLGVLTRAAAVIAGAVLMATVSNAAGALFTVIPVLALAALGIVGPGAYSVDARLFGRRVIYSSGASGAHKRGS